jgi:hypothetical protein
MLLHARNVLFRVAATVAAMTASMTSTTMLTVAACRRRCILRGSQKGRAQRKRCNSEEGSDAIAGIHGVTSFGAAKCGSMMNCAGHTLRESEATKR